MTNKYVDNKKFSIELDAYAKAYREAKKNNTEFPRMNNYLGECILKIANGVAARPNFSGYSYRDEMISDGIESVLLYVNNFDSNKALKSGQKPNAFAYVTQIIYYAYVRRIKKENKQQYIKDKSIERAGLFTELASLQEHDRHSSYGNQYVDMIQSTLTHKHHPDNEKSKTKARAPLKKISGHKKKKKK